MLKLPHLNIKREGLVMDRLGCFHHLLWLPWLGNFMEFLVDFVHSISLNFIKQLEPCGLFSFLIYNT